MTQKNEVDSFEGYRISQYPLVRALSVDHGMFTKDFFEIFG